MKRIFKREKEVQEFVKGNPFFCQFEKLKNYPYLNRNIETDILIVGGGIVGAITNFYLSKHFNVTMVDKSRFGFGYTSCATVLLEYQLDDYADDLLKFMSEEQIVQTYKMGLFSIEKIESFINQYGNFCHFNKRPSLLYTKNIFGKSAIEKEYAFRIKHNFQAKLYDSTNNPFSFDFCAGLYCENGGAEFNPYLFTKQMIENSVNQENLFENTEISTITKTENGYVASTNFHEKIFCKKIIFATGYNFDLFKNPSLCTRNISYTIVTKPVKDINILHNTLLQDDKKPYHYLRLLPDKRIIFGGEDTKFKGKISSWLHKTNIKNLKKNLLIYFQCLKVKLKLNILFVVLLAKLTTT